MNFMDTHEKQWIKNLMYYSRCGHRWCFCSNLVAKGWTNCDLDRSERPASETSYGNAGILASASIIPVPTPGILFKALGMLFNKNQPLFLKWTYLPNLHPSCTNI